MISRGRKITGVAIARGTCGEVRRWLWGASIPASSTSPAKCATVENAVRRCASCAAARLWPRCARLSDCQKGPRASWPDAMLLAGRANPLEDPSLSLEDQDIDRTKRRRLGKTRQCQQIGALITRCAPAHGITVRSRLGWIGGRIKFDCQPICLHGATARTGSLVLH
jgi:hypothetical protein